MVLAHCTSLQCDLSVCEVWSYYLLYFGSYAPDKNPKLKLTNLNNSKNSWNRVMVLVHCTSPKCDLSVFEV